MKQSTRAFVAAAAAARCYGRPVAGVYDYSLEEASPLGRAELARAARIRERDAVVLYASHEERVSLEVHEDLFTGLDHLTGTFFAGAVHDAEVMVYDGQEGRYYKFRVQ